MPKTFNGMALQSGYGYYVGTAIAVVRFEQVVESSFQLLKGAQGALPNPTSRTFLLRGEQKIRVKPHRMQEIRKGDVVVKLSAGGAGVGDAWERPVESVVTDVRDRKITAQAARLIYGVVLDPVTLRVDEAATRKLRSSLPAQRYEAVVNEEALKIEIKPFSADAEAAR